MSSNEIDYSNMDTSASQKRSRPPSDSPQSSNKKKTKKKGGCTCPICLETIIESTKSKSGHDAIYCEGHCNSWLHRRCAGLSKPLFVSLEKSTDPFYCPHCQLRNLTTEISTLKVTIKSLNEKIATLQPVVRSSDQLPNSKSIANISPEASTADASQSKQSLLNKSSVSPPTPVDKKFNIVIYGIKECPPKTTKVNRLEQDLQNIIHAFANVDFQIDANSIKDCIRLGKYKPEVSRPRPILVKFLRSTEATIALSKISLFKAPIHIKPDQTQEERDTESHLLKERWSLTQLGFEKKRIKIRNKSIFIDNKLYGQYSNSKFHRSQYNPPLVTSQDGQPEEIKQASSSTTSADNQ